MVAIIDYGMGNLSSVQKALQLLQVESNVVSDPSQLLHATRIILPGVGHFGQAMQQLQERNLIPMLTDLVIQRRKPVLGICLGMQLLSDFSEEGNVAGLGWIPGKVTRLHPEDISRYKIPHMGWNTVEFDAKEQMNKDLTKDDEFYFVHSYHFEAESKLSVLHKTIYSEEFVSAVQDSNIVGVQYHPEKSHQSGLKVLRNFLKLEA